MLCMSKRVDNDVTSTAIISLPTQAMPMGGYSWHEDVMCVYIVEGAPLSRGQHAISLTVGMKIPTQLSEIVSGFNIELCESPNCSEVADSYVLPPARIGRHCDFSARGRFSRFFETYSERATMTYC